MYCISTIHCLNENSTIFKTINSSVDETRKTLALFNKDWNTYKTNWQQGFSQNGFAGGVKSIFQSSSQNSVISKDQVQILRNWNNAVAHGCTNQETFNRIIANADDNTKMYFAGLNKGKGSIEGLKNAQNVAKQSTIGLTIAQTALNMAISMGLMAAISLAIKGFDKLINSAKRASEAADEAFSDTNEKVQQNEEEAKSLDELISKYKELKENGNLDIDGRKEVKELQNDIADLVGTQAKNLDLVNGKLDDEIKKLDEISAKEAKRAYETATANYNNSQKANAEATGDDSFLFVDGYAYTGKREKEAEKILKDAGFSNNVQSGGFFGNTLFVMDSFDNNMKELKGAQEKADYLQSMIDVLEQNGQRATDLYAGLIKQRDDYLKYIDNQQNAANSLVNSWITYSQFSNEELSKINVDSVESFDTYRQKMIEEAKNDESIGKILADGTLSDEDLEKAVNDFMATSLNFSKWYEQWLGNVQDSTLNNETDISFTDVFNSSDFADTKDKLLNLAKSGELSSKTLSSTEEYADLLKTVGGNAELAQSKIMDMLSSTEKLSAASDGIGSLEDAYNEMKDDGFVLAKTLESLPDVFKDLQGFKSFSEIVGNPQNTADEMQQAFNDIASEYLITQNTLSGLVGASESEIQTYIANLKAMGITNAEEVVAQTTSALQETESLISDAETEYYNAHLDYINGKTDVDANYLSNIASNNSSLIAALGSTYQSDYQNWANLLSKKAEAYNEFVAAIGGSYNSAKTGAENLIANSKGKVLGFNDFAKASEAETNYQKSIVDYNNAVSQLKIDLTKVNTNFGGGGLSYSAPKSSSSKSSGGGSDSSKEFSEEIDWIETAIARIEREITNLNNIVDATYKDWSTRNGALSSELSSITKEISLQQQAYNKYMSLANSVGLDGYYQELVKNGSIDYTTITDEDLADKIKQFKDFYEKALDCQDAVINLQGNIADLADQKISNITSEFDQLVEQLTHDINTIDKAMSLEEAKGRMGSGQYYTAQSNIIAQQQDLLLQERANISSAMKEALSQGISVNSEQYRNWMSQLDDIDEQLQDNEVTIAENTKAIREINDSWFEYQQSLIDSVISEVSFVKDMLDYKTLFNDNGSFTKEGWASIGMSGTNYDIAMAKADEYGKRYTAYKELSKQDPLNKDIEKLMQEALSNQQEALKEAMGYYDDIKSMVQNSLDKMIEHLQELSDNYIEGLNLQKDMYDYQKTINEQTKTIGDLRKQISAYSGDGSEETRATLQSLYNQLKESEKQLQETEYDKWLSDQQTMLDNMMDMAQEWEATYLESFENYLSPWLEEINAHGSEIAAALTDGGTVGIGMSNISNAITDNGNGVISSVDSANNSITNSVNTANEGISGTITIANRGILDALGYSVSDNLKSVIDSFRSNSSTLVSYDPDAKSGLGTLNTTLGNGLTDLKDNSGISKLSGIGALIEAIKLKVVDEKKQVEATATKTTTAVTKPTTTTPQPAPTPAPTPQPSSPQGNGQVDQGDKVKIVSGRFYSSSDGKTPTGNSKGQWNGKEVYITKVKNGAKYPYHVSTGTKLGSGDLGWLKKEQISGYKIGGQNIKDEFAWTQENGGEIIRRSDGAILTPVKGATVFNAQQTDALWNLSKSLIGNSGNLANTNIPDMVLKNGNQTINNDVRMDITLPNVTNYDEFVTQLKADSKFEKFVQSITFGNALGKNTLNKRRY